MVYTPPPQQLQAPPPGSNGSIYENSKANAAINAETQNSLANIGKGGSRRRFKGGATITVPPIQIPYKEAGAGSNTTSANVTNSIKVGSTLNANSQFDACVGSSNPACGQTGGKNKNFKGGIPNWGCMSGGKHSRKTSRKSKGKCRRNTKKSRKCRRRKR
jgi:hypothetical protein